MDNMSIQECPGVQWWIKNKRKGYLSGFLFLLAILAFFCLIAFVGANDPSTTFSDMLGIFAFILLFGLVTISQLMSYFRTFSWQIDRYWYGTIIDMNRIRSKKGKTKGYIIIADVGDGKLLDGRCLARTYQQAQKGQQVLLFSVGNDKVYCVHPNM